MVLKNISPGCGVRASLMLFFLSVIVAPPFEKCIAPSGAFIWINTVNLMVLKTISPGCGVRASLMLFFDPSSPHLIAVVTILVPCKTKHSIRLLH